MALNVAGGTSAVHLIGVSVPRSGHNLVVRLLQALAPGDLFYCERYLASGCCQALPCVRRATRRISFQKSHDLEHDLPQNVADACYLVQHRAPVPAVLSARELHAEEYGEAIAADRDEYAVWLGRWAEYLVTFHARWIADPPENCVVVEYDDLISNPAAALRRIVSAAGIEAADADLQTAVERILPHGGICGERPFVPRSIEGSRYLDRELLATFESIVVDVLPGYAPSRVFEPVEYRGTLIWHVYSALRAQRTGDFEAGCELLDAAIQRWPDNGMLLYEQSWLLLRRKRYGEAQHLLERAAATYPAHPRILDLLVTAALAAGDAPAALAPMRRLAAEVEPTLANRLRLAKVLAHNGDQPGAAEIVDEVTGAAPQDAQVWRDVSEVHLIRGEPSEARLALETAIRLAPLQADLYVRHGDVLLTLGKAHRAVDALRQSLALDPRRAASWTLLLEALRAADDREGIVQAVHEARAAFPNDAELQAAMAEARRWALTAPVRRASSDAYRSSTSVGMVGRVAALVGRLPGARLLNRVRRAGLRHGESRPGPTSQDAIQLAQLRSALGVAEQRLAETEQRMHQELEAAWSQANSLDGALQRLDRALSEATAEREAAWSQAHALAAALESQSQDAGAAWNQAERLDAALAEQRQDAESAWAQARALDAALAENDRALQAALEEVRRLNGTVGEQDRGLREARRQVDRLTSALDVKEGELQELRLRAWRLEEALRAASAMEDRPAGHASLMRIG